MLLDMCNLELMDLQNIAICTDNLNVFPKYMQMLHGQCYWICNVENPSKYYVTLVEKLFICFFYIWFQKELV